MRNLRVAFAFCVLLFFAWQYYSRTIAIQLPALTDTPSDFRPYYDAARNIVHGQSPFVTKGYIYPPLFAFLMTPLAPLDYVTARRVWFGISQLFLCGSAFLLWRSFGRDSVSACWIAFVWALGGAAEESLHLGQVGPLLLILLVVALTRRRWQQGTAVALGFAIKLFPGLLGVALLLRRERSAIRGMIVTAAAAVVLPWLAVACFLRGPAAAPAGAWTGTAATLSWSLPSVALRLLDRPTQVYSLPVSWVEGPNLGDFRLPYAASAIAMGVALLTLGVGLVALLRVTRGRLAEEQLAWAMAALLSLGLAAAPVSWTHYQLLQYPGVALLLAECWRRRCWRQFAIVLVLAALLYPIPVAILRSYYYLYNAWTAHSVSTLYIWTSVTPLASLGLFAMFLRQLRAEGCPGRAGLASIGLKPDTTKAV
jgi:hypothetical protein